MSSSSLLALILALLTGPGSTPADPSSSSYCEDYCQPPECEDCDDPYPPDPNLPSTPVSPVSGQGDRA